MLKSILKLNGAQELSKNEQKSLSGGGLTIIPGLCGTNSCAPGNTCASNLVCTQTICQNVIGYACTPRIGNK